MSAHLYILEQKDRTEQTAKAAERVLRAYCDHNGLEVGSVQRDVPDVTGLDPQDRPGLRRLLVHPGLTDMCTLDVDWIWRTPADASRLLGVLKRKEAALHVPAFGIRPGVVDTPALSRIMERLAAGDKLQREARRDHIRRAVLHVKAREVETIVPRGLRPITVMALGSAKLQLNLQWVQLSALLGVSTSALHTWRTGMHPIPWYMTWAMAGLLAGEGIHPDEDK